MSGLKKALDKFVDVYNHVLCFFGVIFYLTFVVCVLVQVISRNFLPSAPSWTEEAARYSFIYMVAFGSAVAVHRSEFVNVEFLHDALEGKLHIVNKIIDLVIKVALLGFSAYILFNSVVPFAFIKFPHVFHGYDHSHAVCIFFTGADVWLYGGCLSVRSAGRDLKLE